MTRIFMTGLENGDLTMFSLVGTYISIVGTPRTGSYGMQMGTTDVQADVHVQQIIESTSELYLRLGIYARGGSVSDPGRTRRAFLQLRDGSALQLAFSVPLSAFGPISVYSDWGVTLLGSGGTLIQDTWVCVEVHALIHPTDGVVQVKVDGVTVIDYSGNTRGVAASTDLINSVWLGAGTGTSSRYDFLRAIYDDLAINDTLGDVNNSWVGRGGIYPALVTGPGTHSEFTPLAGSNADNVKEVPADEDTSYVASNTLGHRDLYATGGIVPTDGTITAVQVVHRARLSEVGISNLKALVRDDGADSVYDAQAVDSSYRYLAQILELAPDGSVWSVAKINALEIGQQVG